jgi:predicted component of type VI protein secretion system
MYSTSNVQPSSSLELQAYFEVREGDEHHSKIEIDKARLTIGRRSYNDLELTHATVSGEHAVVHVQRGEILVHDLNSRNGTLVNGQAVMQHALTHGDEIEIGIYRMRLFVQRRGNGSFEANAAPINARLIPEATSIESNDAGATSEGLPDSTQSALEPIDLNRPIISVGTRGQHVAVIARRRNAFFITHLEGVTYPTVNGESIGLAAFPLEHDDIVNVGGNVYRLQVSR